MMRTGTLVLAMAGLALAQESERYRPEFHFSPRQHWTNDPNGLVYFEGEYHLFFQYNPFDDVWGHMSWGHAVSPDLVHWQELPVALPEENEVMIFTGSTVVDRSNTSGFCAGGKPCLVAIYTGHTPPTSTRPALQTQNLAYSNDRGRTWTKYPGNPVLNLNLSDFRDPSVIWSDQAKSWIMTVALPNDHQVRFYASANLKQWQPQGEFGPAGATGGQWECPILTELSVNGNRRNTRWLLKVGLNPGGLQGGSGEQYFVGRFDGRRFVNDNPPELTLWTDYGKDCYCALPFNALPPGATPLMLGWMDNWQYAAKTPTNPWRGQMTLPRRMGLKTYPEGIRLIQEPVQALLSFRGNREAWRGERRKAPGDAFEMHATVALGSALEAQVRLLANDGTFTLIDYNRTRGELFVDRTHSGNTGFSPDFPARTGAPLTLHNEPLELDVWVDRSSIEVFAQGGRVAMTNLVFPPREADQIEFQAQGATLRGDVWRIHKR